ncbi:restriction endonuclease subunit S [Vibrio parahaemolyticus]|nr:restriction endonuclease subunit S [Vibrio parahaemolyticus]
MVDQMLPISDVAEIFDGPHATPKKIETGPYFLSISSLEGGRLDLSKSAHVSEEQFVKWTKRVTPQKGDLLFSYETRLGEAALMPEGIRACLGRRMGLLRPKLNKVIPEYLLYAYISPFFQQVIKANTIVGATVDRIALSEMKDFPIRIPSFSEQKAACLLLSTIDKKIELNNRINSELEAMAKTLYEYWFVQFNFPDMNGKPYKASGGKVIYSDTLKREIPKGWLDRTLGDLIKLGRGVTYGKQDVVSKSTLESEGVLRATNVTGNIVDNDDLVYVSKSVVDDSQKIHSFDTLIVMSSGSKEHVGKNGIYYFDEPLGFGAFCSKITPHKEALFFVNTFLQTDWFKAYIKKQCLGTSINNLTTKHILNCNVVVPNSEVLRLFEETVEPLYNKIAINTLENKRLKELRDFLLPMLMNGQVTVNPSAELKNA